MKKALIMAALIFFTVSGAVIAGTQTQTSQGPIKTGPIKTQTQTGK